MTSAVALAAVSGLLLAAGPQRRSDPVPPWHLPADAFAAGGSAPEPDRPSIGLFGQGRVFVNFDGATLTDGGEDARINKTVIGFTGEFAPYGEGPKRTAALQAVVADWAAYNVEITDVRPTEGEYAMAMVGPTNFTGSLGVAILDCNDQWTHNNIVYAFHHIDDAHTAATTATTISQEVAHSFGLEHVNAPDDIMNPFNAGGDATFQDTCLELVPADFGILCEEQHIAQCGDAEHQNSHGELLALFGSSTPDASPPSISIDAPLDGSTFMQGDSFAIEVTAQDDRGVARLTLYQDDLVVATDMGAPWGWTVSDAPPGSYAFVVEALDVGGNVTRSAPVSITVERDDVPSGGTGNDAEDDGSTGPGDEPDPDDPGGDTDPGAGDTDGDPDDPGAAAGPAADGGPRYHAFDEGCACATTPDRERPTPLGLLPLLVLVSRRRESRT